MNPLLIAVAGFLAVLTMTGLGIGLGKLVDPALDRLDSSIEWEESE